MSTNDEKQQSSPSKTCVQHGGVHFFLMHEEHAVYSLWTNGQGFEMTSAAQTSAGRVSVTRMDHAIHGAPDVLGLALPHTSKGVAETRQSAQNRLPRAASEAGLHRITEAMRAALRARQNIHITRKEIAKFAGVTPALVTYYFPEKDHLIEAVTLPIVRAMVETVQNSLSETGDPRDNLLRAIEVMIETYATDAAIVDLFIAYRASKGDVMPDLIGGMEAALEMFFNQWLHQHRGRIYDAVYLQKAAIGMCKIVARRDPVELTQDDARDSRQLTPGQAICAMLLEPMPASDGELPMSGNGTA